MRDRNELSKAQQWENYVHIGSMMVMSFAIVQWLIVTWLAQYRYAQRRGRPFRLQWPKVIQFSHAEPMGYTVAMIRQWGISCQDVISLWKLTNAEPLLVHTILVSRAQWEMADAILCQDGAYILSKPGSKRAYQFTRPWGVTAKARSFDERLNAMIASAIGADKQVRKSAKLGRTYS